MLNLAKEKDIEVLRQAALLLERENQRLTAKLLELTRQLLAADDKDKGQLALRLAEVERQLAAAQKKIFGDSSERRTDGESTSAALGPKLPPKGHGRTAQPQLRLLEISHTIDPTAQVCTACGGALEAWAGQGETSDIIDVLRREFVLVRHTQQKYVCACGGCVVTAPGPDKLVPGARYSVSMAVLVAVMKYLDHMPLERMVRSFSRDGLVVTSQSLWDCVDQVAFVVLPAYRRLHKYILAQDIVGADETWWRLMGQKEDKGSTKRWQIWIAAVPNAVMYQLHDSRAKRAAEDMFEDYEGILLCDGYSVYEAFAKECPRVVLAHCWAHVRRKFVEVEESFPEETKPVLALIRALYEVEDLCPRGPPGDALRAELRSTRSRALVDQIEAWVWQTYPQLLPESGLAKAIRSMGRLWRGLRLFLEVPQLDIDNNGSERAARGPVVGRKNHYGSRSVRGTEVAAILYSLLESAKLAGVDPAAYLEHAVRCGLRGEEIPLPHEWASTVTTASNVAGT